jgi:ATP-dependent helicase/nuclease subunit A
LRFLVDQSRAWVEGGGSGLHEFVMWATTQQAEEADATETAVSEDDDDAVRIMTIHASKGLEFPVVFLTGLGTVNNVRASARVLWDDDDELQLRIGNKDFGWETLGFGAAERLDKESDEAEQARLLYVGATRARDHLVVSAYRTKRYGSKSLAGRLNDVTPISEGEPVRIEMDAAAEVTRTSDASALVTQYESSLSRRNAAIMRGRRPVSMSATMIASRIAGDDAVLPVQTVASQPVRSSVLPDDLAVRLDFGSAVHGVLESAQPGIADDELKSLVSDVAHEYGVGAYAHAVRHSVDLALQSSVVRDAHESSRVWSEVYVTNAVGDLAIGGWIDLLFEREDGYVIVDYKTESVPDDASRARALERYQGQLLTYAVALERTLGRPVVEASLLFIPPDVDNAVCVSVADIERAKTQYCESVEELMAEQHKSTAEAVLL